MKRYCKGHLLIILIFCILALLYFIPTIAGADQEFAVSGTDYVLPDEKEYNISEAERVKNFFYGARSMGTLRLIGAVSKVTTRDDYNEYGVNGPVSIYYTYSGTHRETDLGKWYVDDDAMGKVNGHDFGGLFKGVGRGCIYIEESTDAKEWFLVQDPKLNYFSDTKKDTDALIYNIPEDSAKNGRYYRVVVAYRFCKKKANGFIFGGDFEYKKCIELYQFFICSDNNYVTICDLGNGMTLQDQASTDTGFMIRKNGSNATVTVQGIECDDFDYFHEPGEYTIEINTKLNQKYKYTITITKGVNFTPLEKAIYWNLIDNGFQLISKTENTVFGGSLTDLSLVTPRGKEVTKYTNHYGIIGEPVSLHLKLNKDINNLGNDWVVESTSWGKIENEQIDGITTGEIGKGALIIEKSKDGKHWTKIEDGKYAKGLYTTDYATHYGQAKDVLIYTPSGEDVKHGIHLRVLFAYQVFHNDPKDYRDYIELYQFYLCNNDLGAVTFHNLSVQDQLAEEFKDADQETIEIYKKAETLKNGSYTTTGFTIDKSLNPTIKHSVTINGTDVFVEGADNTFETDGKYDITLTSKVGSTGEVTIYVDRSSSEEAMQKYFGDGFISGKRIFSEGEYPVYEGGETAYYVAAVEDNILPLYGQIVNQTTGSVIEIEQNHEMKSHLIEEAGDYVATFATSKEVFETEGEIAGDVRIFTFRFRIIPKGTAPGPVVNQNSLDEYRHSTVIDSNPIYYGLTYSSAGKGHITMAFDSKEAAIEYAYDYEKGTVEEQGDGTYRYTGSFHVGQKTKFDSAWDLTDDINKFAEEAVQKRCFDMSDEYTYLSLTDEIIESTANLRQLELPQSVTIFADSQKEQLTNIDALPLLNDKPYAYLDPTTGVVNRGVNHFEFITDQYGGIDSKNVTITDSQGGQHAIRYSESVGQQLMSDNCPSGIVTVREETMYGDTAEYQAIYIAPNDNQTELKLKISHGEKTEEVTFTGKGYESEKTLETDGFTITEITDPLDPYTLVIVRHHQKEDVLTAIDMEDATWTEPGEYRITCVNRMGYSYTVPITVTRIVEEETAEATGESLPAPEPQTTEKLTTEKPISSKAETDKSEKSTDQKNEKAPAASTEMPDERTNETQEKKTENNNLPIILGIIAGVILIAGLILLTNRRIKRYSRMTDNLKSEGEDKHE